MSGEKGKKDRPADRDQVRVEIEERIFRAALACLRAAAENERLAQELLGHHRLRDRGWRGATVIPFRRLE